MDKANQYLLQCLLVGDFVFKTNVYVFLGIGNMAFVSARYTLSFYTRKIILIMLLASLTIMILYFSLYLTLSCGSKKERYALFVGDIYFRCMLLSKMLKHTLFAGWFGYFPFSENYCRQSSEIWWCWARKIYAGLFTFEVGLELRALMPDALLSNDSLFPL